MTGICFLVESVTFVRLCGGVLGAEVMVRCSASQLALLEAELE